MVPWLAITFDGLAGPCMFAQASCDATPLLPTVASSLRREQAQPHGMGLIMGLAVAGSVALLAGLLAAIWLQPQLLMRWVRWLAPDVVWFVDDECTQERSGAGHRASAALSIDDAPHGDGGSTEAILDLLAAHGAKATFFVIARQVQTERHRALLRRMVGDGHELCASSLERSLSTPSTAPAQLVRTTAVGSLEL